MQPALHPPDARYDAGRGGPAVLFVHLKGGPEPEFLKERAGVDEAIDPLAGGQPVLGVLTLDGLGAATGADDGFLGEELGGDALELAGFGHDASLGRCIPLGAAGVSARLVGARPSVPDRGEVLAAFASRGEDAEELVGVVRLAPIVLAIGGLFVGKEDVMKVG